MRIIPRWQERLDPERQRERQAPVEPERLLAVMLTAPAEVACAKHMVGLSARQDTRERARREETHRHFDRWATGRTIVRDGHCGDRSSVHVAALFAEREATGALARLRWRSIQNHAGSRVGSAIRRSVNSSDGMRPTVGSWFALADRRRRGSRRPNRPHCSLARQGAQVRVRRDRLRAGRGRRCAPAIPAAGHRRPHPIGDALDLSAHDRPCTTSLARPKRQDL